MRENILDAIKVNIELKGFRKTYKEILFKVIQIDFPHNYLGLVNKSIDNLKNASNQKEVLSALVPIKLLISNYEMTMGQQRKQLEALIPNIFPYLENYAMKFMNQGSGDLTITILTKILKCFLMCNYMNIEAYFRGEKLKTFLFIAKTVLDAPLANPETAKISMSSAWEEIVEK